MNDDAIAFNGIDGATGEYLLTLTPAEIAAIATGEPLDPDHVAELRRRYRQVAVATLAPIAGVDATNLAEAGWGVVFPRDGDPAVQAALTELIEHRRAQASAIKEARFRVFAGEDGWWPNEGALHFLERHGSGPGPVDPDVMPFYLLLVGDPEQIPFRAQYQLDVQHAVGRLHFATPLEYARYARSVIAAETGAPRPRTAAFVGVQNPDDPATNLSAPRLVAPLAEKLGQNAKLADWAVSTKLAAEATKTELARHLGGDLTPTFLFTASHGMGFPNGDPRQLADQGALLCQDWPGPKEWRGHGPIPKEHYLAADDVGDDANLLGTVAFHFACYGAGTPRLDDFGYLLFKQAQPIAPAAFVAPLPQRLLGHPNGGALAVVGHVERAWGYSFDWKENTKIDCFLSAIECLFAGQPIGAALDYFNIRYAELASHLTNEIDEIKQFGKLANETLLTDLWTANGDARGYVILGDPAVRINAGDVPLDAARPSIGEVRVAEPSPRPAPETPDPTAAAAAATSSPAATNPTPGFAATGVVAFGITDWIRGDSPLKEAVTTLSDVVRDFADRLGTALQKAVDDASSVTVKTYVADDLNSLGDDLSGPATLRAVTRMNLDGDTEVWLPKEADPGDGVWAMHADMVGRAQANRTELLKAAVGAATGLLGAVRGD